MYNGTRGLEFKTIVSKIAAYSIASFVRYVMFLSAPLFILNFYDAFVLTTFIHSRTYMNLSLWLCLWCFHDFLSLLASLFSKLNLRQLLWVLFVETLSDHRYELACREYMNGTIVPVFYAACKKSFDWKNTKPTSHCYEDRCLEVVRKTIICNTDMIGIS